MSKKLKVMFFLMVVVIAFLGCALISVAVTLGQPVGTTNVSAEVYEAPALNAAEPTEPEVAEPAVEPTEANSHPLGWSVAEEAEAVAYAEQILVYLDEWLRLTYDAQVYNEQMIANPMLVFDISWVTGYYFVMDDWINHAEECMAWNIPVAPLNEVDHLMKQSCIQSKASARSMQRGLDLLPDDIDGLIFDLDTAVSELQLSNQYMNEANARLDEINSQLGY